MKLPPERYRGSRLAVWRAPSCTLVVEVPGAPTGRALDPARLDRHGPAADDCDDALLVATRSDPVRNLRRAAPRPEGFVGRGLVGAL